MPTTAEETSAAAFMVWMAVPNQRASMRPWTCIARNLTEEQAKVYEATCLFPVSVQPEEAERSE